MIICTWIIVFVTKFIKYFFKDIVFYVEVLSIRDATADEIIEGGSIE